MHNKVFLNMLNFHVFLVVFLVCIVSLCNLSEYMHKGSYISAHGLLNL